MLFTTEIYISEVKSRHHKNPHRQHTWFNAFHWDGDVHDIVWWALVIILGPLSSFSVVDCTVHVLFPEHCLALLGPTEVLMPRLSSSSATKSIADHPSCSKLPEGPQQLLSQLSQLESADQLPPLLPSNDSSSSFPPPFPS